jgi:hypothetical protein
LRGEGWKIKARLWRPPSDREWDNPNPGMVGMDSWFVNSLQSTPDVGRTISHRYGKSIQLLLTSIFLNLRMFPLGEIYYIWMPGVAQSAKYAEGILIPVFDETCHYPYSHCG